MSQGPSWEGIRTQFFWITPRIAQGPFASEPRGIRRRADGVTHILNVGEAPNVLSAGPGGFREVAWHPVEDLARIPDEAAIAGIEALHRMLGESDSKVYVHCIAGQNRSPTVLWLFLVACGLDPAAAKRLIGERNMDAVPGHSRLVDEELIRRVVLLGREDRWTTARAGLIDPF
jgi:protein-tyrosine phosphatase